MICRLCHELISWPPDEAVPPDFDGLCDDCYHTMPDQDGTNRAEYERTHAAGRL